MNPSIKCIVAAADWMLVGDIDIGPEHGRHVLHLGDGELVPRPPGLHRPQLRLLPHHLGLLRQLAVILCAALRGVRFHFVLI